MSREFTIESGGMEFGISLTKHDARIYYGNSELSDFMRMGFVPHKEESMPDLEKRVGEVRDNYGRLLKTGEYRETPADMQKEFLRRYGVELSGRVLIKDNSSSENAKRLILKNAKGKAYLLDNVGIVEVISTFEKNTKLFMHEAMHCVFDDNPFVREEVSKHWKWFYYGDRFPLPMLYSRLDKAHIFNEMLPAAFLDQMVSSVCPFPAYPGVPWLAVMFGSEAVYEGTNNLFFDYFSKALALSYAARIPRSFANLARGKLYKHRITKLRKMLCDKNAMKLMMVSSPDSLKQIIREAEKL